MQRIIKKGDTLIEVLFAMAVFSFLSITTISLMNQTTASAQGNLESTQARNLINQQAEIIRFAHEAYINDNGNTDYAGLWNNISGRTVSSGEVVNLSDVTSCDIDLPDNAFAINASSFDIISASPIADAAPSADNGFWIYAVEGGDSNNGYYDFYFQTCWYAPGRNNPTTIDTVIRLYDTRSSSS